MSLHASGGFVWPSMRPRETVHQAIATNAVAPENRRLRRQSTKPRMDGRQISGIFQGNSIPSLELLSGERPFRGETAIDTMQAILRQDPAELPESVPAAIRQTVAHCLEKEPGNRFQSAQDLSFALAHIGTQSDTTPVLARPIRWPRWATIARVAAAIGGLAGAFLRRAPEPSQWFGTMLGGPDMALNPRISPHDHLLAFQAIDSPRDAACSRKVRPWSPWLDTHLVPA
jgi:serine/threonine protein kinase